MRKDERNIIKRRPWTVMIITYIVVCLLFVVASLVHYSSGGAYEVSQAEDWLWRARATNDLTDMSHYLNQSLVILDRFDGNPNWIFPRPDTDFGLIKDNIRECVRNCEEFSLTTDDMAYQQAVHNIQETIVEIASHLDIAGGWLWKSPLYTLGVALFIIFILFGWAPILTYGDGL
jgi:hypothetical protein